MDNREIYKSYIYLLIITVILSLIFKLYKLSLISILIIILILLLYKRQMEHFDLSYNNTQLDNNYEYDINNELENKIYKRIQDENNIIFRNKNNTQLNNKITNDFINAEIGYYDSDNKLRFDRTTNRLSTNNNNLSYECKRPSNDNPFMNIDLHDFDNKEYVSACNADDDEIHNESVKSFNDKLFMNLDDSFEKTNSQRQFFTTPNTRIPNNQIEFANWLYKSPTTCKEDNEKCLRYEDLRYHNLRY